MRRVARLSTHVLDTVNGRPAAGVTVELRDPEAVVTVVETDADGRALVLEGLRAGAYELRFAIGAYFGEAEPFLDWVPVRFVVRDPEADHHVPLLCTPWSYTTYRGS
jgi:5-hydroxyisourate hydrolase